MPELLSFALTTVTPPATAPVTVAEAKAQCRVDWDDEDDLIGDWVDAATTLAERETGRRFVTQTLKLTLPGWVSQPPPELTGLAAVVLNGMFPGNYAGAVCLPVEPVQSVSSVRYYAADGTLTTLAGSEWQTWLAYSPPLLAPAPARSWPALEAGRFGAVEVTFVAGYGAASAVPAAAKSLIRLTVGFWYRNRGDGKDPASVQSLGLCPGADRLIRLLRTGDYR